ncbi:MAG: hypothetical protein HC898_04170 [Phycisphaerales bacterium]|nr:hypothetical protein [Phycisphaerales bacterium]
MPDGMVLMNFRNASLDSVLTFLSEAGGLTIINDQKIEGRINVLNRQPMTLDEALEVLDTLLKDKNLAAVRTGKTLKIMALDAAKKAAIPVRQGSNPESIAQSDQVITQVIPVRFADAVALKRDLTPLIPAYAELAANASTNTLILTDTSNSVRRIVEIIRSLDTSVSSVTKVRVFNLKFANATSAARLINEIFQQDQTGNQRSGQNNIGGFARFFTGQGSQPGGRGGQPGGSQGQGGDNNGEVGKPQPKSPLLPTTAPTPWSSALPWT